MSFAESLLASLAAGALWALLYAVTKRYLIPAIRSHISDELDLGGQWYCQMVTPAGNPHEITLDLKQRWRALEGRMTVVKHIAPTGATEIKSFAVWGNVRDRFVVLQGRNTEKRSVGVDTELLEVVGDGRTMRGVSAWYSTTANAIESMQCEWVRAGSSQPIMTA